MQYKELIKNIKILLADDDEDYLLMTDSFLKQIGYNVECASDGKEAVCKLKSGDYQIALLDYFMPGLNGEEVIEEIRRDNKELIIILQTGFSGQKPPIETMQRLNIQNYFDKTEGIDRLNLELTSAVKIFNQQNEIELTKYRANTIGQLISNIAEEIKSDLLSIGAGIEVTNMMITNESSLENKEDAKKLKDFYEKNKKSLEKIDKILDALVAETKGVEKVFYFEDITYLISLIIKNEAKKNEVNFVTQTAIKSSKYITGDINNAIFIACELLKKIISISDKTDMLEFIFTEDDKNWILNINSSKILNLKEKDVFLLKRIIGTINNLSLEMSSDKININILKDSLNK